ncbi:12012_t:CDS:2, partial [Racocetra fulgida]
CLKKARSNQHQHVDYENLDIDLVEFLKNSMLENKYQLFWIPPEELKYIRLQKTVRYAYWKKTHSDVVCKELVNLKDINGGYYDAFIHELNMHARSDLCENIVRFLGVSKDAINDQYFLIMEYANDGNLRSFLKKNNHLLNWYQRLELAYQITKGLCYLHSEEIIHRDL